MSRVAIESDIKNVRGAPRHSCYFCHPHEYPPMPSRHTLCARCGCLITTPVDDRMNESLFMCPPCESEIMSELRSEAAGDAS